MISKKNTQMKKQNMMKYIIMVFVLFIVGLSCKEEENLTPKATPIAANVGANTGVKVSAVGVELDPHFFSQNVTRNASAADWDIVIRRVRNMRLQYIRVMVLPEWFEPYNDDSNPQSINWSSPSLTFNSPEMQSLYKVLDLAQESNISVNLVMWGCGTNVRLVDPAYVNLKKHFLAEGNSHINWVVAPVGANVDEWCENYSILVQHLLNTKNYSCVKLITPYNEPNLSYFKDNGILPAGDYIAMCKKLDQRFRTDGIRDRVSFNLADNSEDATYLARCVTELADIADLFTSHVYQFDYTTKNSEIVNWEKTNRNHTAAAGKDHFIGEFGSHQYIDPSNQKDIDFYERGVLMTRIVLNVFNAGACGASYWSLLDQYYWKTENHMQRLGLWRYKKEDYASETYYASIKGDYDLRPQYYAYALLTRFVRAGYEVYPVDLGQDFVAGTAFKAPDGKWTYVFANGNSKSYSASIANGHADTGGEYDVYRYTKETLPESNDDRMIDVSETILPNGGKINIELAKQSVTVLKQY
jgi:alpha-galactosidase